jgi:hypothetical protein
MWLPRWNVIVSTDVVIIAGLGRKCKDLCFLSPVIFRFPFGCCRRSMVAALADAPSLRLASPNDARSPVLARLKNLPDVVIFRYPEVDVEQA